MQNCGPHSGHRRGLPTHSSVSRKSVLLQFQGARLSRSKSWPLVFSHDIQKACMALETTCLSHTAPSGTQD